MSILKYVRLGFVGVVLVVLTACDGGGGSEAPENHTGGSGNTSPTANAGADKTAQVGQSVDINGSVATLKTT